MQKTPILRVLSLLLVVVSLAGCASPAAPTADPTQVFQNALLTATYGVPAATQTPAPTETLGPPTPTPIPPTATPDPNRTPPALPATFTTTNLSPLDVPHTYVADTCQYLRSRWDPNKAAPGTVVMTIMFHSVTDGEVTHADQIHITQFHQLMKDLRDQDFETISPEQLADFMETNARIPRRSVLLIVDDRKRFAYFDLLFKSYFDKFGWTVTNAWISAEDTPEYLWKENQDLENAGYVNHQAHGVVHNINATPNSTDDFLRKELEGSIQAIQKYFNKTPIAYIWPGGGFTRRAIELAREAGYRLGFTINPRGPVMYNWVPLAEKDDPNRPSYIPDGPMQDPLMVLPRYWDTDASYHIDTVRQIGKEAAAYAEANRAAELEYYDIVCAPTLGPIPTKAP